MAGIDFKVPYSFWRKLSDTWKGVFLAIPMVTMVILTWYANTYFQHLQQYKTRAAGNILNVKDYGSVQNAINAASPGDSIYVPSGTWSGTTSINGKSNLTIYGDGINSVLVSPGKDRIMEIINSSNITVKDLAFTGDYAVNYYGIVIANLETGTFEDLYIKNMYNSGIFSNGRLINGTFRNNRIEHCGDFGITVQSKDNTDDSYYCPINILVENNYFDGFESKNYPAHAIYLSHTIGGIARGNEMHNIWNPNPAKNASGITISRASTNVTIENNLIDNSNFGLHIAGGEISDTAVITNSVIRNNIFSNITTSAILFYINTDNTVVDRNAFNNVTYYAIAQYPDTGSHTNVHITNNVTNNVMAPIYANFLQHAGIIEYTNNSWQPGFIAPAQPTGKTATITTSPPFGTYNVGDTFNVKININGWGQAFNAAKGTVAISSNLRVQSLTVPPISSAGCNFTWANNANTPTVSDPSFSGAILNGSSTSCTVYTLTLKVLSGSSGTVTLSNGSVKSYSGANEILNSLISGSYALTSPISTPTPTSNPIPTNTPTPTPRPTSTPTPTPSPTLVPTSTPTPKPTSTPTPTPTSVPTSTPTPLPTNVPTPTPTTIVLSVPTFNSFPSDTYKTSLTLTGKKTQALSTIYVNSSLTGVTYPDSLSWSIPVSLVTGTNTFTVYGKDAGGNISPTGYLTIKVHSMGDINGDRVVDLSDLSLFGSDYENTGTLNSPLSDMNGDGAVDLTDFSIIAANYNGQ